MTNETDPAPNDFSTNDPPADDKMTGENLPNDSKRENAAAENVAQTDPLPKGAQIQSSVFSTADDDQDFQSSEQPPGTIQPATITDDRNIIAPADPSDATILSDSPPFEYIAAPLGEGGDAATLPKQFFATGTIPLGSELGHFKITKYIGGGGMGRVYEAIDKALDRKVAIKVLPRQRAQDAASVARFLNEARSAARLNHEHIAQVYFCGEEHGIPFIAFEYVQGINIRAYVERSGVIPLPKAINFLLQIAGALAHAAMHGVTHRDVKPSNILITQQGKAKLIDMGLARLLRPSDPTEDLTVSGVTLGTFDYISPEQARDPRLADVRSDIYSLGCTFFFMLTGQPPFPEGTVLQKLLKHQGDEPPDVRTFVPGIPAEVVAVVQKMMAKDPANRFQTPDELIAVLVGIAESIGLQPTGPDKTDWVMPKVKKRVIFLRHLPWISAVAALVIAVGVYRYLGRSERGALPLPNISWPAAGTSAKTNPPAGEELDGRTFPERENPDASKFPALLPEQTLPTRLLTGENSVSSDAVPFDSAATGGITKSPNTAFVPSTAGGWGVVPLTLASVVSAPEMRDLTAGQFAGVRQMVIPGGGEVTGRWSAVRDAVSPAAALSGTETSPAAENRTILIVDRIGERSGYFSTLESALVQTVSLTDRTETESEREIRIELAFNGPLEVPTIEISGRSLRIAAAAGFRPQLIFRPKDSARAESGNRMFLLTNAGLELENLLLDVDLSPREEASVEWSLFEIVGATTLTLIDSTLTMREAEGIAESPVERNNAAFFRLPDTASNVVLDSAAPQLETGAGTPATNDADENHRAAESPESVPFTRENAPVILMTRTFLRGEAAVWSVGASASGHLEMTASGFCVDGPVTVRRGDTIPLEGNADSITVAFDRVCGVCRSPLFRERRLEPGREIFSIKTTVSRSLLKLSDTPVGELIADEFSHENAPAPDWTFGESLLYNVSALWRFRSAVRPEEFRDTPFNPPRQRRLENITSDADRLASIPPHLTTPSDLNQYLIRPVETDLQTAAERATVEAIRDGLFRRPLETGNEK